MGEAGEWRNIDFIGLRFGTKKAKDCFYFNNMKKS